MLGDDFTSFTSYVSYISKCLLHEYQIHYNLPNIKLDDILKHLKLCLYSVKYSSYPHKVINIQILNTLLDNWVAISAGIGWQSNKYICTSVLNFGLPNIKFSKKYQVRWYFEHYWLNSRIVLFIRMTNHLGVCARWRFHIIYLLCFIYF